MQLPLLDPFEPQFPDPGTAFEEPPGLLAAGGNLNPQTLVTAYRQGIFPWFEEGEPILWWSPSPRCVLYPEKFRFSKSLVKSLRKSDYSVTTDSHFEAVIHACSEPRRDSQGTWITTTMIDAYTTLFSLGYAHSVEVWKGKELIGGLYGIKIGACFCGESMFSRVPNASKIAMAHLCYSLKESAFRLIDCQLENPHLLSLGAETLSRELFLQKIATYRDIDLAWPKITTLDWKTKQI